MGFILDMQDLETPEAPSNAMASGSSGGGSTVGSTLSVTLCGSHSSLSVLLCH